MSAFAFASEPYPEVFRLHGCSLLQMLGNPQLASLQALYPEISR